MPNHNDDNPGKHNAIAAASQSLSKELKSDKNALRGDIRQLRKERDEERQKNAALTSEVRTLTNEVRTLDVAKTRLEGKIDRIGRDVQFFRDTKSSRKFGATVLVVCGALAPLFFLCWWSLILYYCLVSGAVVSLFWGVWFSRIKTDETQ